MNLSWNELTLKSECASHLPATEILVTEARMVWQRTSKERRGKTES
jgi:hypothetical protein